MQIGKTHQPIHIMDWFLISFSLGFTFSRQEKNMLRTDLGEKEVGFLFSEDWAVITSNIYVGYDNTKQFYLTAVM